MRAERIHKKGLFPENHLPQKGKISFQRIAGGQSLPAERTPARIPIVSINHEKRRRRK
jgi:hypothetical protein